MLLGCDELCELLGDIYLHFFDLDVWVPQIAQALQRLGNLPYRIPGPGIPSLVGILERLYH